MKGMDEGARWGRDTQGGRKEGREGIEGTRMEKDERREPLPKLLE